MSQQQPLFVSFLEDHEIAQVGGAGQYTTLAVGEEGHGIPDWLKPDAATTSPLNDLIHMSTMAVGEEGPVHFDPNV
ncbi:hypothetical protein [Chromobacterium sp. IIBBL 290-4]|uniref:hypothetical protein n=1 Tax=Chromobacterium sp. IIBBL 290-4 TaxID=2953890 RepID=UPI0020B83DD5|nr:hypothetical protein [Chromobacterium sp. IIBBL 290-4]UTH75793.1 hypothetical protein NKT35_06745 [Chromobacterium sp. IIBBL 290-4]